MKICEILYFVFKLTYGHTGLLDILGILYFMQLDKLLHIRDPLKRTELISQYVILQKAVKALDYVEFLYE